LLSASGHERDRDVTPLLWSIVVAMALGLIVSLLTGIPITLAP
jgi:hypothetical protein